LLIRARYPKEAITHGIAFMEGDKAVVNQRRPLISRIRQKPVLTRPGGFIWN
jgi:hypothetical protein